MITPGHKSLAAAPVTFPRFAGTTYLFDNPGKSLKPHESGLSMLTLDLDAPEHELYQFLHNGLRERLGLVQLMDRYRFRPVPSTAMHVTVCDHVNPFNIDELNAEVRDAYRSLLEGIPASIVQAPPGLLPPSELHPEGKPKRPGIRFRFGRLDILKLNPLSDLSLVAILEPSSASSEKAYAGFSAMRRRFDEQETRRIGKPPNPDWIPHVTLGYFPNEGLGESARHKLPIWDNEIRQGGGRLRLAFSSVHLYAFADMTQFFRVT